MGTILLPKGPCHYEMGLSLSISVFFIYQEQDRGIIRSIHAWPGFEAKHTLRPHAACGLSGKKVYRDT